MANKRDDDFALRPMPALHLPRRSVVSRLAVYALLLAALVYTLTTLREPSAPPSKQAPPPAALSYSGRLRFPQLAGTLRPMMAPRASRSVLFAAGSARGFAALMPLACGMAEEGLSEVHVVLVSRGEVPMGEMLEVNGVDEGCAVVVHDGRPEWAGTSADARMRLATVKALNYMRQFVVFRAIVVEAEEEEGFFLEGAREHVRVWGTPLVELPRAGGRFSWLAKLDPSSLSAWNDVRIDILVQAPAGSGNLKRLLRSLARTDLSGMPTPRVTIELPPVVDKSLATFLAGFQWPEPPSRAVSSPQMLSLRHRIARVGEEEEAALRFWESFWPDRPFHSHVLILSAHAEVTPQFFHYVKYLVLKYRSSEASRQARHRKLLGFSFSSPRTQLDGVSAFTPPKARAEYATADGDAPFLWQAPASDSMLIMGDKWVELHGFVSRMLEAQAALDRKEVGEDRPLWLQHVLELSRLRGYVTLYPSAGMGNAMLGVHTDLPDAYGPGGPAGRADPFDAYSHTDMLEMLPGRALPALESLPWLSWDGTDVGETQMDRSAALLRKTFRAEIGQCSDEAAGTLPFDEHANDLFCAAKSQRTKKNPS